MALVSITRLRVRSWRYLPAFFVEALRSALQARSAHDSLAVSVLRDVRNTFWTRTLWADEGAMRAFLVSGSHKRVMPRILEWCDEAAVAHWLQDSPLPPTWDEAHRRLQYEGRASKVNHPTSAQRAFEIPAPKVRAIQDLRFKSGACSIVVKILLCYRRA